MNIKTHQIKVLRERTFVARVTDCLLSDIWNERRKALGLPPKRIPAKHLKRLRPEELPEPI